MFSKHLKALFSRSSLDVYTSTQSKTTGAIVAVPEIAARHQLNKSAARRALDETQVKLRAMPEKRERDDGATEDGATEPPFTTADDEEEEEEALCRFCFEVM